MFYQLTILLLFSIYCLETRADKISSILTTIEKCIPNEKFVNINIIGSLLNYDEMTNFIYENFYGNETKTWYKKYLLKNFKKDSVK